MPDGRRRSREGWADAMEDGPPVAAAHTHRLPPIVRASVAGLVLAVFLLLIAVGIIASTVYQQQQYISGRGELRDKETVRLQEQLRQAQCDLLDQLPEGGLLQRPREKYHCGPGIPRDQLPPAIQQRYESESGLPPVMGPRVPNVPTAPRTTNP